MLRVRASHEGVGVTMRSSHYQIGRFFLFSILAIRPAMAQTVGTSAVIVQAAGTITAADVTRHIGILAADSMFGRATPSLDLNRTAVYLRTQFQQQGLDTVAIQEYRVPGQLSFDPEGSMLQMTVVLTSGGRQVLSEHGDSIRQELAPDFISTAMYFAREVGSPTVGERVPGVFQEDLAGSNHVVVLAGRYSPALVPDTALYNKVVVYIPFATADSATRRQILARLYAVSAGVLVVSDLDSIRFAAAAERDQQQPVQVVDGMVWGPTHRRFPFALVLHADTIARPLRLAEVDVARLRADSTRILRELSGTSVHLIPAVNVRPRRSGLNVASVLVGSDSILRREILVISAHMDAGGIRPGRPDSIDHGADDNASGVAGLLALARAFTQPGARPRRSLVFVATSGTGDGQAWGSTAYLEGVAQNRHFAAALNLDRLGGRLGDSVSIDGMQDVAFAPNPRLVAAEHPELNLTVVDGGTVANPGADYVPFVRLGVPTLGFHSGTHGDPDDPDDIGSVDPGRTVRLLQLVFYVSQYLANAEQRPRWTEAGRAHKRDLLAPMP